MALCMNCMSEAGEATVCPYCGFDSVSQQLPPYLPFGTILKEGRYVVGKVQQTDKESVLYIGFDYNRDCVVKIREFFPASISHRDAEKTAVVVSEADSSAYDNYFNEFVIYYRILAGLKGLSANVEIVEVFPENNTCYVVEEDEELLTFAEYVKNNGGRLEWNFVRPMLMPVVSLLEAMHDNGIGHYALSAQNVFITPSGKLKLRGFATEAVHRISDLNTELPDGISAPEQYMRRGVLNEQTDVYGFTALMFYILSGYLPDNATKREVNDNLLISTSAAKRLPPYVLSALVNGLYIDREKRTPNFEQLRVQLSAEPTVEAIREEISRTSMMKSVGKKEEAQEKTEKKSKSGVPAFLISFLITILIIGGAAALLYYGGVFERFDNKETEPKVEVTEAVETTKSEDFPVIKNYVSVPYEEALRSVENTRIEIVRSYETVYSDVYEEGVIVSQRPEAGTKITSEDGSAVIYVEVSSGSQMRTLPDIAGYDLTSATELLGGVGFIVTELQEYSASVVAGAVIGYDGYIAGDRVEVGSTVIVRVSKGAPPSNDTDLNPNADEVM